MKDNSENTIMCDEVISPEIAVFGPIDRDPLDGLGKHQEENFYKLNVDVFAEPLKELVEENKNQDKRNEFKFHDKVTVEKEVGKRNKYHFPIENATKLICPQTNCNKEFSSTTLLRAHVRKIHCAEFNYICEYCAKTFTAEYLLIRHKMVHEVKVVECPICSKKLSGRTNLSVHIKSHTNTRQHKCDICCKTFVRKCTLDVHKKFVHNKELKCEKCGERFEKRNQLTRHMPTHNS